jgi:hypothetical protein
MTHARSYSKGITVEHNPNSEKPWWVLDDGLCYDRYATKEEAEGIAATLVAQDDLALKLELDLNELIYNFANVNNLLHSQVRTMIKEQLS